MRVLVTGSRDWNRPGLVYLTLERMLSSAMDVDEVLTVVHGACPTGADAHADAWARLRRGQGLPVEIEDYPANWRGPRKRGAGYARNAEMVKLGADICLAFILDESTGATHCSELAEKAGIETQYYRRTSVASNVLEVKRAALARRDVTLKGVQIIYRNFEGREDDFNQAGNRYFHVLLDPFTADILEREGYNIKRKPAIEEGGDEWIHMKVKVNFKGRPPTVALISKRKGTRNTLNEETVELADHADFESIDLTISPYDWKLKSGKTGRTAYLNAFYGILYESELDALYAQYIEEAEAEAIQTGDFEDVGMDELEILADTGWEVEGQPKGIEG